MRKKLIRFQANAQAHNLIEEGKPLYTTIRGRWHTYFQNQYPIILELGCGQGTYTIALATENPHLNYIGVDIKGDRLWTGSQCALKKGLSNVVFLRTDIKQLNRFFAPHELISKIYLPFPDPQPRLKYTRKRLTSLYFLKMYAELLAPKGQICLKTDSIDLFTFTRSLLPQSDFTLEQAIQDLHKELPQDHLHRRIITPFEERFLKANQPIHLLTAVKKDKGTLA